MPWCNEIVDKYSQPEENMPIRVHAAGDARSRSRSPPSAYVTLDGATEPAEFTEEEEPKEFQITIVKETPRTKIGVTAERKHHPPEFQIRRIGPGLLRQWNEENPTETVIPGDTIFEVNGVNSSTEAMCNQFDNAQILVLKIRRRIEGAEWID